VFRQSLPRVLKEAERGVWRGAVPAMLTRTRVRVGPRVAGV
jgi:hypothetical protein